MPCPQRRIGDMLKVAYPVVRQALLENYNWVSPELRNLERQGIVEVRPLGAMVEVMNINGNIRAYPVTEVTIPIIWTVGDEKANDTVNKRIGLVKNLLEHAFNAHDDIILRDLGRYDKIVASREYRYDLGNIQYSRANRSYIVKLYTALAFTD